MGYWTYNLILTLVLILLSPAFPLLFILRFRWLDGFRDRLAFYSEEVRRAVQGTRPVWIHAVSVGEVLSTKCLVEELRGRFPDRNILVSSSTATGVEMARKIATADAVVFFPWDHPWIISRAFQLIDPVLLILLETEIWPNFLWMAHRKGIPVLLLSGRISVRSLRRYQRFGWLFRQAVRQFTALGMQTEGDAERMSRLGAEFSKIWITGNLKYYDAQGVLLRDERNGKQSETAAPQSAAERKLWVAGSTHRGEEAIILDVHGVLKLRFPGLNLVLAPRHPHRFLEVEELLQKRGVAYAKRSQTNGKELWTADVLLLDTVGELPGFYAKGAVAFVGGSLVNVGGHNILEPARLRKPVFFGPFMDNFSEAAAEMEQNGGGVVVRTREDLVGEMSRVLADPAIAHAMGELAHQVVAKNRGGIARSMQLVSRYLD